jgi:hypothetical protein
MRSSNEEHGNECNNNFVLTSSFVNHVKTTPISKFNASFERKVERLWFQSRHLGLSYNEFVVHLLEVLVVLRHRDSVKREAASESRATVKSRLARPQNQRSASSVSAAGRD